MRDIELFEIFKRREAGKAGQAVGLDGEDFEV